MEKDSKVSLAELKVDGGAVKNNLLMQLQSDILGKKVVRPVVNETTALGAAYAAGLAVGFWKNMDDLRTSWVEDTHFEPIASDERRKTGYKGWEKAIEKSKGWVE